MKSEGEWEKETNWKQKKNPSHIMKNFVFCLARQVSNACINCCLRLHLMWCRGRFAQVDTITITPTTAISMSTPTTTTETAKANRSGSSNTSEREKKTMYVIAVQTKAMFAFIFEGGFGLFPKWFCCYCWWCSIPIAMAFSDKFFKTEKFNTQNLWKHNNDKGKGNDNHNNNKKNPRMRIEKS